MLHRAARPAYCASLPFPPPTPFLLVSPWACSAAILIRLPAPGDAKLPCDGLMSVPEAKMQNDRTLIYKIASEAREFEQIHALNYRTFVDEIPQHAPAQALRASGLRAVRTAGRNTRRALPADDAHAGALPSPLASGLVPARAGGDVQRGAKRLRRAGAFASQRALSPRAHRAQGEAALTFASRSCIGAARLRHARQRCDRCSALAACRPRPRGRQWRVRRALDRSRAPLAAGVRRLPQALGRGPRSRRARAPGAKGRSVAVVRALRDLDRDAERPPRYRRALPRERRCPCRGCDQQHRHARARPRPGRLCERCKRQGARRLSGTGDRIAPARRRAFERAAALSRPRTLWR